MLLLVLSNLIILIGPIGVIFGVVIGTGKINFHIAKSLLVREGYLANV